MCTDDMVSDFPALSGEKKYNIQEASYVLALTNHFTYLVR